MGLIPATTDRVPTQTDESINQHIREETADSLTYYASNPGEIDDRLRELDAEWDIERTLEANASALAFLGVVLGATVDRRFLVLSALVTGFLFQHAVQGWCPPLPVLRRLGVRTQREISTERHALVALQDEAN